MSDDNNNDNKDVDNKDDGEPNKGKVMIGPGSEDNHNDDNSDNKDKDDNDNKDDKGSTKTPNILEDDNSDKGSKQDNSDKSKDSDANDDKSKDDQIKGGEYLDEDMVKSLNDYMKENELTPKQVQPMVDMYDNMLSGLSEKGAQEWENMNNGWADEVRNDNELGGKNLTTTIDHVKKAIDVFGDQETQNIIKESGLVNRLPVVKMLSKIGKLVSDDKFNFGGGSKAEEKKTDADTFYGK